MHELKLFSCHSPSSQKIVASILDMPGLMYLFNISIAFSIFFDLIQTHE